MNRVAIIVILLLVISLPLFIQSCGGDDGPKPIALVIVERNSGKLFTVDPKSAVKTEIGQIIFNSAPLTNIRALIYSAENKILYASTTDSGGGKVYTINLETLGATLFDGDVSDHWYGVADLLMTADNRLLGILWFKSAAPPGFGAGLQVWNTNGTIASQKLFTDETICCGFGMIYGTTKSELIISSDVLEIYKSDLNGNVDYLTTLTPSGFDAGSSASNLYIQNMVKDSSGKIFSIVYNESSGNSFLAEINLTNNTVKGIGQLNVGNSNWYHALVLLSKDLL